MIIRRFIQILILFIFTSQILLGQTQSDQVYLSMEDAIERALAQNNLVKASEYSMKKSNWDKKQAWTQLFPTLHFNTRYTKIDEQSYEERDFFRRNIHVFFPGLPSNFEIPQSSYPESFYSSFDVNMPIFNGAVLNGLFIAGAAEDASIQINKSTKRNITFLVIKAYLDVLYATDVLSLQNEQLNLSRLNFEKAERLHNAGRYSKAEALRWKVEYQQQKSMVVNSESLVRTTNTVLKRLVNIKMDESLAVENKIPSSIISEGENIMKLSDDQILQLIQLNDDKLMEVNAALSAAKSNEEVSKHLYHNSYSSYMPNVNLSYSYGWRENNTIELDDYSPKTIMINFSMPIFTSFQNFTAVKSSYYEYKSSQENFYDQLQNTRLMLTDAVNKIINLKTQIELNETSLDFSEKNYNIIEQQKEEGLVSNLDFIDAKLNLQNVKLEKISSNYEFISAIIELYYMLGKLDEIIGQ